VDARIERIVVDLVAILKSRTPIAPAATNLGRRRRLLSFTAISHKSRECCFVRAQTWSCWDRKEQNRLHRTQRLHRACCRCFPKCIYRFRPYSRSGSVRRQSIFLNWDPYRSETSTKSSLYAIPLEEGWRYQTNQCSMKCLWRLVAIHLVDFGFEPRAET